MERAHEEFECYKDHERILRTLRGVGTRPVVYDIGACVLHWTRAAQNVFPDATYVLFDGWGGAKTLYEPYMHHFGILGSCDGSEVMWYENDKLPWGNSMYREKTHVFPVGSGKPRVTRTLDSIVREKRFPLPDIVNIDVQGSEKDVIQGGLETLEHAKYLIVEMQHEEYNEGAPKFDEVGPWLESLGWVCKAWRFSRGGTLDVDADYLFMKNSSI
jgi:Methyltransferase FkbM domain